MTRSAWKIPFVDGYLIKKAKTASEDPKKPIIKKIYYFATICWFNFCCLQW